MFDHMQKLPSILILIAVVLLAFGLGYSSYPLLNTATESVRLAGPGGSAAAAPSQNDDEPGAQAEIAASDAVAVLELAHVDAATLSLYKEVWDALEQNFYGEKPGSTERIYGAIHGLVESFDDPYTFFLEPEPNQREQEQLQGRFGGIGAQIESTESGYVLHPMRDRPAENAGVRSGDLLLAVDETHITTEMSSEDVVTLIRGPVDTPVTLTVSRTISAEVVQASGRAEAVSEPVANSVSEQHTFTIVRAEIEMPSMDWRLLTPEELPPDGDDARIGYIQQRLFSNRSPDEMRMALEELRAAGADRFILDLRGNPGGYVDSAVAVADLWLDAGVVMTEKRAHDMERVFESTAEKVAGDAPLVVIVDGASASASEILAGALQDRERALLLGEKTFGKGSVQIIYELTDQSSVHITNAVWFTPDGHKIDGQGLTPDVVIELGSDPVPQAVDLVLTLEPTLPVTAQSVSLP
jgi:carboxyl-terminal processing protease